MRSYANLILKRHCPSDAIFNGRFGLPVLEAMSLKCLVIASDIPVF